MPNESPSAVANPIDPTDIITVTRIIEYTGPRQWVLATLARCQVPLSGVKEFASKAAIKSGVVDWGGVDEANTQPESAPSASVVVPPPEGRG